MRSTYQNVLAIGVATLAFAITEALGAWDVYLYSGGHPYPAPNFWLLVLGMFVQLMLATTIAETALGKILVGVSMVLVRTVSIAIVWPLLDGEVWHIARTYVCVQAGMGLLGAGLCVALARAQHATY